MNPFRGRPVLTLAVAVMLAEFVLAFRDKLAEDRAIRNLIADFNERRDVIDKIREHAISKEPENA